MEPMVNRMHRRNVPETSLKYYNRLSINSLLVMSSPAGDHRPHRHRLEAPCHRIRMEYLKKGHGILLAVLCSLPPLEFLIWKAEHSPTPLVSSFCKLGITASLRIPTPCLEWQVTQWFRVPISGPEESWVALALLTRALGDRWLLTALIIILNSV